MGKHFELSITEGSFSYRRRTEAFKREARLDGIYVIHTREPEQALSAEETVRGYKNLAPVERAFRTLKGLDRRLRPLPHRGEQRVRAPVFLCLLAYYLEWPRRQVLASLLFDDEALPQARKHRNPVVPAEPSASAKQKKIARVIEDG